MPLYLSPQEFPKNGRLGDAEGAAARPEVLSAWTPSGVLFIRILLGFLLGPL